MALPSLIPDTTLSVEKSKIDASSGDLSRFAHDVFFFVFFKVNLKSITGLGGQSELFKGVAFVLTIPKLVLFFFYNHFLVL